MYYDSEASWYIHTIIKIYFPKPVASYLYFQVLTSSISSLISIRGVGY